MRVSVKFTESSQVFEANFKDVQTITKYVGGEQYSGEYVVTPKVDEQTLETKDKVLTEDVTIKSIPFFKVSNNKGGDTVYIGNEV